MALAGAEKKKTPRLSKRLIMPQGAGDISGHACFPASGLDLDSPAA